MFGWICVYGYIWDKMTSNDVTLVAMVILGHTTKMSQQAISHIGLVTWFAQGMTW
jgi:hypothetical protein